MSVAGNKMAVINGKPPDAANTSSSPSSHEVEEVTDKLILEDPPVDQIEVSVVCAIALASIK